MAPIQAVIFDMDGTLLDSNDAHALCYQKAFKEAGYFFDFVRIRRLIGMGGDHLVPTLAGLEEKSEEGRRISARKRQLFFEDCLPHLRPFPDAKALIQALHDRGIRVSIATSAKRDELECLLRVVGIEDLVDSGTTSATSDDAKSSKPDPDIVVAALNRLGIRPEQAVMVGDTPYDLSAAEKAGVKSIALRTGGWTDEDLRGASMIFQDPAEMLSRLDSLPYFWHPDRGYQLLQSM